MKKLMKPKPLSFYILNGTLYFNSSQGSGMPHPDLWRRVVVMVFSRLTYENKIDLFNHCYGIDRGRVVYKEKEGKWVLYGTRGCKSHQKELVTLLALDGVSLDVDFETDPHYKTVPSDVKAVEHSLRLCCLKTTEGEKLNHIVEL